MTVAWHFANAVQWSYRTTSPAALTGVCQQVVQAKTAAIDSSCPRWVSDCTVCQSVSCPVYQLYRPSLALMIDRSYAGQPQPRYLCRGYGVNCRV